MPGNYDKWLSNMPDPHEFDDRQDEEKCPDCGADPDDECAFFCSCIHCDRKRQREMDERERESA
jgi:hypothetical protein